MTTHPIIIPQALIPALKDGRKHQHREVLRPQPEWRDGAWYWSSPKYDNGLGCHYLHTVSLTGIMKAWTKAMPYAIGDKLWVQEDFMVHPCALPENDPADHICYRADGFGDAKLDRIFDEIGWDAAETMPERFSRFTLLVTDIRIQRLQEVSEEDALHEGLIRTLGNDPCRWSGDGHRFWDCPREAYRDHWNATHKPGEQFEGNPWVIASEIKACKE